MPAGHRRNDCSLDAELLHGQILIIIFCAPPVTIRGLTCLHARTINVAVRIWSAKAKLAIRNGDWSSWKTGLLRFGENSHFFTLSIGHDICEQKRLRLWNLSALLRLLSSIPDISTHVSSPFFCLMLLVHLYYRRCHPHHCLHFTTLYRDVAFPYRLYSL